MKKTCFAVWLGAFLTLLGPRPLRAEKKEWTFSLVPGYALAYVDRAANGGGGGGEVSYGITDSLSIRASGFVAWHAAPATDTLQAGTLSSFAAIVGVNYLVDVIRLRPSFDFGIGAVGVRGTPDFSSLPTVNTTVTAAVIEVGFGLDYAIKRWFSLGAVVRGHFAVSAWDIIPFYLYAGPRVCFRVGG